MRSGNDQFPHGGISIVASSVTRFDTPKINSPVMRSERGREKKKSSVIRTTNAHESPYGVMRGSRGANFPRVIAPLHRSNSATLKETARAALAELVSSGCDRVQKSICHLVCQGPETRSFASERRRKGREEPRFVREVEEEEEPNEEGGELGMAYIGGELEEGNVVAGGGHRKELWMRKKERRKEEKRRRKKEARCLKRKKERKVERAKKRKRESDPLPTTAFGLASLASP
ncbi:hypothetical protein ALC53_08647 [Atta colombica]|uniref:Uncharacterized protein n=1 Tax=Atta colombica TaxID=520822 RepID=A0A151I1Y9_9HYME|nr:hypothetical protein ALC53_08647 [Atta colombica]